jgi:hypothetical protein
VNAEQASHGAAHMARLRSRGRIRAASINLRLLWQSQV